MRGASPELALRLVAPSRVAAPGERGRPAHRMTLPIVGAQLDCAQ